MTLSVVSCAKPKALEINSAPLEINRVVYPRPLQVPAPDIRLRVVVDEGEAVFGFDADDYITFSSWLEDILHYAKSQAAIIRAYERDAEQSNLGN